MKKGQVWVQDAIASVIIIITALSIFIVGYENYSSRNEGSHMDIQNENRLISEYLMLEGTPVDWNESNVLRIGILNSDYTLNETKLNRLYNLTISDYDLTRLALHTRFDYMIFFEDDDTLVNISSYFIGKEGMNNTNILDLDTKNIAKTERFVIYQNGIYKDILKMTIYSWEEN